MIRYAIKRMLQSLITLFVVITLVFTVLRLMPIEGYFDPLEFVKMSDEQIQRELKEMGLADPFPVQLFTFYKSLLKGDLGDSMTFRKNVSVTEIIAPKIPYSLFFGLAAVLISLIIGIPLGMIMAATKGKIGDKIGTGYIVFINSVPAAVYFIFIQIFITDIFKLPMLFSADKPISWILPAISMSLGGIASYAMWIRRYMVDQLNQDYIKLARAKGLKKSEVMKSHVIRNAFVPMAQYLPSSILFTIAGSIYIESLYSIPGMGGLLVTAIQKQDNNLVQALVLIFSSIGIFGLFLGDVLMAVFDPRIKLSKDGGAR